MSGSKFKLVSKFKPMGDQPAAIERLAEGFAEGKMRQTLLGVTGSGKTFTVANIIQKLQKRTLVLAPNKTLAAQLFSEFKEFFPDNAVEYFVSYYDYYQPEATWAELVECGDFTLVDSPGVRSMSLTDISDEEELLNYFPDIADGSVKCKFRNCEHGETSKG